MTENWLPYWILTLECFLDTFCINVKQRNECLMEVTVLPPNQNM